jgi:chromosome segregation ATPase
MSAHKRAAYQTPRIQRDPKRVRREDDYAGHHTEDGITRDVMQEAAFNRKIHEINLELTKQYYWLHNQFMAKKELLYEAESNVKSLEEKMKELLRGMIALGCERDKLSNDCNDLRIEIAHVESKKSKLKTKKVKLESKNSELQESLLMAQEDHHVTRATLHETRMEFIRMRVEQELVPDSDVIRMENDINSLLEGSAVTALKNAMLRWKNNRLTKRNRELEATVSELRRQSTGHSQVIDRQSEEIAHWRSIVGTFWREVGKDIHVDANVISISSKP